METEANPNSNTAAQQAQQSGDGAISQGAGDALGTGSVKLEENSGVVNTGQITNNYYLNVNDKAPGTDNVSPNERTQSRSGTFISHTALTPKAVFGIHTASRYENDSKYYYWPRPHDEELDELLAAQRNVLIFGQPLAGKTRSVWEALRRLGEKRAFHFLRFEMPHQGLPSVPDIPPSALILFDDIDEAIQAMEIRQLGSGVSYLNELLRLGAQIVATCRFGVEYLQLAAQQAWNRHLDELFTIIDIPLLDDQQLSRLETIWTKHTDKPLDKGSFDHTIGSLFLQVAGMKARWATLAGDAEKYAAHRRVQFAACLPGYILQALYLLLRSLKAENGVLYEPADMQDYLHRRFADNIGLLNGWDEALAFLLPGQTSQGFLRREGKQLYCEPVYLEEIVGCDDWAKNLPGIAAHLRIYYDNKALQERGFIFDPLAFYREVSRPPTPKPDAEIDRFAARLKHSDLRENVYAWNVLLKQVSAVGKGRGLLAEMRNSGATPDEFTYNALLGKALDYQQARAVLAEMRQAGVKPDEVTYNTLLDKAPDYQRARVVLAEMHQAEVKPDEFTYNTLLGKAPDYKQARCVLAEMRQAGVKPDEFTYTTLLDKAPDYQQARAVLDEMTKDGAKPDVFTYNTLLGKAPDYQQARAVLDEMRQAGANPNEVTYSTLLRCARDFDEAHRYSPKCPKPGSSLIK